MSGKLSIVWSPQEGPQKALIDCPLPLILYGGARGGGKTDGVLGKYAIKAETYGESFNAIFFRRELPMLDDAIERSQEIYGALGAKWQDQKKQWRFPGGGRIRFRPLERVQDADKYQGQNVTDVCVEEVGIYPDPKPIDRLNGILRSAKGVPTQMILTGNPGGAGQHWIKKRFIDPCPAGMKVITDVLQGGYTQDWVFIPSKLENNKRLLENDPRYISRLYLVGSPELVKAWLDGDWSAIEGAFFDNWSTRLIVKPFEVPEDWSRFKSFDWGSARPFSVGWWAIATDQLITLDGRKIRRGALVRYREWYGSKSPNVGLKMTAEEVGKGIAKRSKDDPALRYGVSDPAAFTADGGPSIMERLAAAEKAELFRLCGKKSAAWRRADNKRIARNGAMGGWDQMRQRIGGDLPSHEAGEIDRLPEMVFVFDTCADSIRTIPALQHDVNRPEDLDTDAEDHAADEWRYACMSRPLVKKQDMKRAGPITSQPTVSDLMQLNKTQKQLKKIRI